MLIADGNFTNRSDVVFAVLDAAVWSPALVVEARLQAEADERQQEEDDAWWHNLGSDWVGQDETSD